MRNFSKADESHLQAAVGWLELGNWKEANEELENIEPAQRAHPDVLKIRVKIYVAAGKWNYVATLAESLTTMLPDSSFGPLHHAHAYKELKRQDEAKRILAEAVERFPGDWRVNYALACAYGRFGERALALRYLEAAIDQAGQIDIRLIALEDPDLQSVWTDISEI